MVRKKVDNRIRVLIENGVKLGHRSLFVVVGKKARDQVVILHHMLSKAEVKARPSVLWCYKKELGFSSHRKKRMKHLQHRKQCGTLVDKQEDDPFDLFVTSTKIRYCYYSETHKILGNTYGMCVLQDFEALTPNLMARTIETVEGGGLVVFLLTSVTSLKQLYTLTMDVHVRFRTEAHQTVVPRFNERFLLSLVDCKGCLFINDQLDVLPITAHTLNIEPVEAVQEFVNDEELNDLKQQLDNKIAENLVGCCKTLDQAKAVISFVDAILEKSSRPTVSLTAARGRGKSAALGLAVSAAISYGYKNIFVTSPSPENLNTFFEFVSKGLEVLEFQPRTDFTLVTSGDAELHKAVVRVEVFRHQRQIVQYISPAESQKLALADLVVIDEAAAIPLPHIKALLGPYLVFLASTVNGYEGTGRSLTLKLFQQLRVETANEKSNSRKISADGSKPRTLNEVTLDEPIRYKAGDKVEKWLTKLLCLNALPPSLVVDGSSKKEHSELDRPENCSLYYINRDTLFCHQKDSEKFLKQIVGICVASHYKYSPNDLQTMSDAPAHNLFCLMGRLKPKTQPKVLVVIEVALEGEISQESAAENLSKPKKSSGGDLIPWTISQQFIDPEFARLAGGRIVQIAAHPELQGKGYGTRAMELLRDYYEFKIPTRNVEVAEEMEVVSEIQAVKDRIEPRQNLPPLMLKLDQRRPEKLHYLGAYFGLTENLLKFFKNSDFLPLYLKHTPNDITGEHSCIMLKILNDLGPNEDDWLAHYWEEFRRRFITLLEFEFGKLPLTLAFYLLMNETRNVKPQEITKDVLNMHGITSARTFVIRRQLPKIAKLYFLNKLGVDFQLLSVESAILLGKALQHKTEENLAKELDIPPVVIRNKLNEAIEKIVNHLKTIIDTDQSSDNELVSEEEEELDDQQQKDDQEMDSKMILDDDELLDTSESKKKKKRKSKKSSQVVPFELVGNKKIAKLIKNGLEMGHRTLFAVVGCQNKYQVVNLHRMYTKASGNSYSSVLWCHNSDELELNTSFPENLDENRTTDDPLEQFLSTTKIQYCRYGDLSKNKISTETYAVCVLQDFQALTPSLLVRTTETVQGGGLIIILFNSVASLKDLYTLDMNCHAMFKTEAEYRFNQRLILSLGAHSRCLIVDDSLNILPLTYRNLHAQSVESSEYGDESKRQAELEEKRIQYQGSDSIKNILSLCKTSDQCTALLKMIEGITEKSQKSTVSLCGPRSRGKTAILGLGVAAAVELGYSNIFVTSANPESLRTFFKFVLKGFDALNYEKNKHYDVICSKNPEFSEDIVRINVKEHRRTINYIHPTDSHMLFQAELLVIDEAASIPLDLVKSLLGPYSTFVAFTTSGLESAGRSLVFKLEQELRQRALPAGTNTNLVNKKDFSAAVSGRTLEEVTLTEPVRYKNEDSIEQWLSNLLCLSSVEPIRSGCPLPDTCDLYYVNRDTLFSYHKASEDFLRQLEAVYSASSYKNIPDDLQILCDAPNHHLFCLMGPMNPHKKSLPGILVALELCLEGEIPAVSTILQKPERPPHDLLPWTVTREYKDLQFSKMSGARILKIATHPDYQGMGYATKALRILRDYYEMKILNLDDVDQDPSFAKIDVQDADNLAVSTKNKNSADLPQNGLPTEQISPEKNVRPLLMKLSERLPEQVDYLGVDFDLSEKMFRFWKKSDFVPVCLKPTKNEVLANTIYICTSLYALTSEENSGQSLWLSNFERQFLDGFMTKLSDEFREFSTALALSILSYKAESSGGPAKGLTKDELDVHFTTEDMKCLEMYSKNLGDFHLVKVLVPVMATLYFRRKIHVELTNEQLLILLGIGLQHKSVESLSTELDLPPNQIMGLFNRMLRKFYKYLEDIIEADLEKALMMSCPPAENNDTLGVTVAPLAQTIERELEQWEEQKQQGKLGNKGHSIASQLKIENLAQYVIRGTEDEWAKVLTTSKGQKNLISVKSDVKRPAETNIGSDLGNIPNKKAKTKTKTNNNKKKNKRK